MRIAWRRRDDGATALADLRQAGCLKARFPRPTGAEAEAILLNSSGGVAGGDRLATRIEVGAGAAALVTTQAAERFYRALPDGGPAHVTAALALAPGASLAWLPQEAILFDGCALRRQLAVTMAGTARFLGIEALVFGRAAHGEAVRRGAVADTITLRRDGRLIWHDATRIAGDIAATLARPAVAAGARAVATVLWAAPDATSVLDRLRHALSTAPVEAGASAWDGMAVARLLAPDAAALRAGLVAGLMALRPGLPLPRAWEG